MMSAVDTHQPMTKLKLFITTLFFLGMCGSVFAQATISSYERERNRQMLREVKNELARAYYDPTFHGLDIEQRFKTADEKLKKVQTNSESFYIIAAFLAELDDSHTFFSPPSRSVKIEHGWTMQMIGDECRVVAVKPGSDAAQKGLKEGDRILSVTGFTPTRENFWKMKYLFYNLNPVSEFKLVVQPPKGEQTEMVVNAKRIEGQRVLDATNEAEYMKLLIEQDNQDKLNAHRYIELGDDLMIWKLPQFDLPKVRVDDMMAKVGKRKGLIIDLRGNSGGSEETLLRLLGYFTDEDYQIGEIVRRKERKPIVAKTVGDKTFKGKLVVLIDSESASASEVLARTIQMLKRGTVIGDVSSGAVMRSNFYPKQVGVGTVAFYGVSVTDADLVMADGKSLEKTGVTPDRLLLPSGTGMRTKSDYVLSHAASLLGVEISPEKAGTLFPFIWK